MDLRMTPRYALPILLLALAGCVNEGNKLEKLRFTSSTDLSTPLAVALNTYLCFPQVPSLIGEFSDGTLGDFTRRSSVRYSSSDPTKLEVSNGDIALPDASGFYTVGALIPRDITNPGGVETPVTVTASFAGLSASVQVVVHDPGTVVIEPVSSVSTATGPFMAPGSVLSLKATSSFDGRPVNITGSGTWSFDAATGDDTVATIGASTGVVSGFAAGTRNAKFLLAECPARPIAALPVTVATIDHLDITREFAPTDPIIVSPTQDLFTTDAITTIASFDAGGTERQDLSGQAALRLTPSDTTAFVVVNANLLRALQEFDRSGTTPVALAPVTVTASFKSPNTDSGTTFTATTGPISAKEATLQSVAIPAGQQDLVIAGFGTQRYNLIGSFLDDTDDTTVYTQDISRHAGWTVSDTTVAFIGNNYLPLPSSVGLATSLKNEDGCVTVKADTFIADTGTTTFNATTLLGIGGVMQPCTPSTTP